MSRWIKISLKVAGILIAFVLIVWIGITIYVHTHKEELLNSITNQLNENISGTLRIEKMEPALIRGFPGISVSLMGVLLRDSLWENHRHDVLKAEEAFISVDAFSILSGAPTIKNITINNGKVHFYTDSSGYSNADIFKKKPAKEKSGKGNKKKIDHIELKNVELVFEQNQKAKLFNFAISRLSSRIVYDTKGWKATTNMNMLVKSLAFKTSRGSFIKNQKLEAKLKFIYNEESELLAIPPQEIRIGKDEFELGGRFSLSKKSSAFELNVKTKEISLSNASALLSPNIGSKISRFRLAKPLSAGADINGSLKSGSETKITAYWQVKDNTLFIKDEKITNCNFTGKFSNKVASRLGTTNENSAVSVYEMNGKWHDIPFTADSVIISNLKVPGVTGKFAANFDMSKLNSIFGSVMSFGEGTARLDLLFNAPSGNDQFERYINGTVRIAGGSLKYLPANLSLKGVKASLIFQGQDLLLQDINVSSGKSSLQMQGSIRNFLKRFDTDPAKMVLDWNIKSPQLDLGEFVGFLGPKQPRPKQRTENRFARRLRLILTESTVKLNLNVDRLIYKKFLAQSVNAGLTKKQDLLNIDNVSLKHSGGSLKIKGNLDQGGRTNKLNVNTSIQSVNVQQLFYAFNNFGQNGLTDKNLRGTLTADCQLSGLLTATGDLVPKSGRGTLNFTLKNGALLNFEPVEKIGKYAFRNRDCSNITFQKLSNKLTFRDGKVTIPPMEIQSSVLTIRVQGVYGFYSGTNLAIQVPLRDPQKDLEEKAKTKKQKKDKKGIILNLQAVDAGDGKVKIKMGKEKAAS